MRTIRLDCRQMEDRERLHDYLAQTLEFPSWYGRNLDALYDLLCDQLPVCLILTIRRSLKPTDRPLWRFSGTRRNKTRGWSWTLEARHHKAGEAIVLPCFMNV